MEELYYYDHNCEGKWSFYPKKDSLVTPVVINDKVYNFNRVFYTKAQTEKWTSRMIDSLPELVGPTVYTMYNEHHNLVLNVWRHIDIFLITIINKGKVSHLKMEDLDEKEIIARLSGLIPTLL